MAHIYCFFYSDTFIKKIQYYSMTIKKIKTIIKQDATKQLKRENINKIIDDDNKGWIRAPKLMIKEIQRTKVDVIVYHKWV